MAETVIGLVLFFVLFAVLFTAVDMIIMGFLSLLFSSYRMEKVSTICPLIRLDEETITYQNSNNQQISLPRTLISRTKKTEVMDKLEIVQYIPNSTVNYWLWEDLIIREPEYNLLLRKGEE